MSAEFRVSLTDYLRRVILARSEVSEARMHADRSIAESKALMIAADETMATLQQRIQHALRLVQSAAPTADQTRLLRTTIEAWRDSAANEPACTPQE
jgi:hypothetical protein